MGVFIRFFSVYLDHRGFSHQQIASIYSLMPLSSILVTVFIGYFTNKFALEQTILKLFAFLSCFFSLFYLIFDFAFSHSNFLFLSIFLITLFLSVFRTPITPILDSLALDFLRHHPSLDTYAYGRVRLWGSLGFIFGTSVTSFALKFSFFKIPQTILGFLTLFLFLTFLSSLKISTSSLLKKPFLPHVIQSLLCHKLFGFFLLTTFVHVISLAGYHGFFSLFLLENQYPSFFIGIFTFISVFSEVVLLSFSHILLRKWTLEWLFPVCFALTALRWFLVAFFKDFLWILLVSETLHAISWGLFYVSSIHFTQKYFPAEFRTTGLTLFATASLGLGSISGYLLAGIILEYFNFFTLFLMSFFMSCLAIILSFFLSKLLSSNSVAQSS